jgi:hypothetical protein
MKIYTVGCSFTYGDELNDPHQSAWPVLLANKLNASVFNNAVPGGTNARTVYHTIKNTKDHYDLYLISWTDYSRFTYYKSDNNFEINFNAKLKHSLFQNSSFYKNWGSDLYKYWYNELYAYKIWLQQIIQLQTFLESKNKSYLMINSHRNYLPEWTSTEAVFKDQVKNLINFDIMNDDQILAEHKEIQYYLSLINKDTFFNWGDFFISQLCATFPTGPGGHILETGHEYLADLIYTHLCSKSKL